MTSNDTAEPHNEKNSGWRGSKHIWLEAAKDALIQSGVDNVKIQKLATDLNISRTSFYWFFKDRTALLNALIDEWERKNSGAFVQACESYAETIAEGVLNLIAVFHKNTDFDAHWDFAIRSWAHTSPQIAARVQTADEFRLGTIRDMFLRFGYAPDDADVRARTVYLTQIGYIALQVQEDQATRMSRVAAYVHTFCGHPPTQSELDRFQSHVNQALKMKSLAAGAPTSGAND